MTEQFTPHGQCTYIIEDNIITIDAMGPWNLEFFKKMHRELIQFTLNDVDYKNYAVLVIFNGDSLATNEGLDYHLQLLTTQLPRAVALITTQSDYPQLTESVFKKIYDRVGLKNQFFDSTEAAKAWLLTHLVRK